MCKEIEKRYRGTQKCLEGTEAYSGFRQVQIEHRGVKRKHGGAYRDLRGYEGHRRGMEECERAFRRHRWGVQRQEEAQRGA